jgi:uncharacterized membrane protein YczE
MDASTVVTRPSVADLRRRLPSSIAGMAIIGAAIALSLRAELGLAPWDVLHEGLETLTGLPFGPLVMLVGLLVLVAWIPLGQRFGIGTVLNVLIVGPSVDLFLAIVPEVDQLWSRVGYLALSIALFGVGGGLYIGSALGPGPRDGLMTALTAKGFVLWKVRTVLELSVLAIGFALGGTIGPGTVVLAFALGPVTHVALAKFHIPIDEHRAEVLGE